MSALLFHSKSKDIGHKLRTKIIKIYNGKKQKSYNLEKKHSECLQGKSLLIMRMMFFKKEIDYKILEKGACFNNFNSFKHAHQSRAITNNFGVKIKISSKIQVISTF